MCTGTSATVGAMLRCVVLCKWCRVGNGMRAAGILRRADATFCAVRGALAGATAYVHTRAIRHTCHIQISCHIDTV